MYISAKKYPGYMCRLRARIKTLFGFELPPVPKILFQTMKKLYNDCNGVMSVPIPIFNIEEYAIPEKWLRVLNEYYTIQTMSLNRAGWILWPINLSKKTIYLGEDLWKLKEKFSGPIEHVLFMDFYVDNAKFPELPTNSMATMVSARELWLIYNLIYEMDPELFYELPKDEWVMDNMCPGQETCHSIVHIIDGKEFEYIRICPYNKVATERKISYRAAIFFPKSLPFVVKTGFLSCHVELGYKY